MRAKYIFSPAERAAALDRAADILDRDGWCRFEHTNVQGEHCAIGALDVAAALSTDRRLLYAELMDDIHDLHDNGIMTDATTLSGWNDRIAADKEDVQNLFRTTAQHLRGTTT